MDADIKVGTPSAQFVSVVLHETSTATSIAVSGELDLGSVHHLEECLSRAISDGDGKPIHLDMGDVSFVDCAGFEPIIRAANALRDGRVLRVTSVSPRVQRLVELMGDVGVDIDGSSAHVVPGVDGLP
jgi:anti-anti-sigma factor